LSLPLSRSPPRYLPLASFFLSSSSVLLLTSFFITSLCLSVSLSPLVAHCPRPMAPNRWMPAPLMQLLLCCSIALFVCFFRFFSFGPTFLAQCRFPLAPLPCLGDALPGSLANAVLLFFFWFNHLLSCVFANEVSETFVLLENSY